MKFLILLSSWLAFAAIASAQDCKNGQCGQPVRTTTTRTVTEYAQPTRYVYLAPQSCQSGTCGTQAGTVVYVQQTRHVGPIRRLFGCR